MLLVITLDRCSRKTQWSSLLDWTFTYTTFTVAIKAKSVINRYINIGQHITTIRGININPGIL